jgi:hypothetical protein
MRIEVNLLLAWIWILLGCVSGAILGSFFHQDGWLGGYGSFRRRMFRLGHISFFGLAFLNLLFYFTVRSASLSGASLEWASRGFVLGALTMPACCVLMAIVPRTRLLFAVPVVSLLAASVIVTWQIAGLTL